MIKSETHSLTLAYSEVSALEDYLYSIDTNLERFANGASYAASAHGITLHCVGKEQAEKIWDAVLEATPGEDFNEDEAQAMNDLRPS